MMKREYAASVGVDAVVDRIISTFAHVGGGLLVAAVASFLDYQAGFALASHPILTFIVSIGLIFAVQFTQGSTKTALYYLFTAIMGASISAMVFQYFGANVVAAAFVATAATFGGLTFYVYYTRKSFLHLGTYVFWSLLAFIIASLIMSFMGAGLSQVVMGGIGVVIFSMAILYDHSRILETTPHPIDAAMSMFLNIFNMFIMFLQIFGGSRD